MKNKIILSQKIVQILSKPFKFFFGSDERGFFFLFLSSMTLYFSGFPDAAIIFSVYSAMFGYSGMQAYQSSCDSSQDSDLEEVEEMMDEALGMAEEFKQKGETE